MNERPEGADLLATARALFETELLPTLSGRQRHAARMIMRAMDLAMRQMLADRLGDVDADERRGLLTLLEDGIATAEPPSDDTLAALNRRLVERIRRGEADPGSPSHGAVLDHLRSVARQRLSQSNPRLLDAAASLPAKAPQG